MIGLVLAIGAAVTDHRRVRILAPVLYAASVVGLILVLVPGVGAVINGSRSWIQLPWMSVQPSEFAKLAVIVGMALLIAEKGETNHRENARTIDVAQAIAVAAVPVLLVMLQPDLGTVMVLGSIVFGIIAVSGVPKRWMLGIVTAATLIGALAIKLNVLKEYQLARFTAFADPSSGPAGHRLQREPGADRDRQRRGLRAGVVPRSADAERVRARAAHRLRLHRGRGGARADRRRRDHLLFALILWRGLRIAVNARDAFGRLVATGVVCWFAFQAFENIGMTLGIMPVTGLPLPFVSYGGSSMFAGLLAVGLLQNIHLRSHQLLSRVTLSGRCSDSVALRRFWMGS